MDTSLPPARALQRRKSQKSLRPEVAESAIESVVEILEDRRLFAWIGALSGNTNDAAHQYNNTANWAGAVIDDSFAGVTFSANTTIYFTGARTTGAGGLNLNYSGNVDLVFKSSSTTTQTLTLGGNLTGTFGGSSVTIGDSTNPLNVALGGSVRTSTVAVGQSLSFVNVVSGTGGVAKAGGGTMTMSGTNTYSGGTTLSAGQLNINSARGIGTGTFTVNGGSIDNTSGAAVTLTSTGAQTWNADIDFGGSGSLNLGTGTVALSANRNVTVGANTLAVGGVVSGAFSLTKSGTGSLTLSATNTFSGGATLAAGQLNINSARAIGTGPFTLNGGTIDNTSGAAVTLTSTAAQSWNADFSFVGSSSLNLGTGAVTLGANRAVSATASTATLTVGGVIDDGGNGHAITKSGSGGLTLSGANTFSGGVTLSAGVLNINNAAALGTGVFTIQGGSIDNTTAATITVSTANLQHWDGDFSFVGTRALSLGGGAVTLGGNRTITSTTAAIALTVAGAIGDGGNGYAITKAGAGTLVLSSSNTYSGGVALNAGVLSFANGALGSGNVTIGATSTLQWAAGNTQDISAALQAIGAGVVATFDTGANVVPLAGTIGGNGSITKIGSGSLTLSGNNTYSGGTTLTAGTLNINSSTAIGAGTLTISATTTINNSSAAAIILGNNNPVVLSANVTFTGSKSLDLGTGGITLNGNRTITANASTLTVGGVISGAFSLSKAGAGVLTLSNANTYSGGTAISAGTLNTNHATAIGTGTLTITGGTINNSSGSAVTWTNNNPMTWGGNFTYGGTSAIDFGNGAVAITGSRTVTVTAGTMTVSGVISGVGLLTKAGNGTLTLATANTYSGGTTLSAGTLNLGTATSIGTGTFAISGGTLNNTSGSAMTLSNNNNITLGSFTFAGTNNLDLGTGAVAVTAARTITTTTGALLIGGVISGVGSVIKAGAGSLTLSGSNTHSGGTTLTAGTLNITTPTAVGTGTLSLNGGTIDNTSGSAFTLTNNNIQSWGGNFTFAGSSDLNLGTGAVTLTANRTVTTTVGTLVVGGAIGGARSLTKLGGGTLTLGGSNTFSLGMVLSAGQLNINTATAIGTGPFTVGGGTIDNTSGSPLTLTTNNSQTWSGDFTFVGSSSLNMGTGAVALSANRTATINGGTFTMGGVISGAFSLNKSGNGIFIATGSNTFTGGLVVNAGAYYANNLSGSGTGSGAVTVNSGATLAGTGRASGAVTIAAGATLSPGVGGTSIFHTGNLILAAGATVVAEINGDVAGTDYDQVSVTGTVDLGGATLNLSGTRATHNATGIVIVDNDAADATAGEFAGFANGDTTTLGVVDYTVGYSAGSGNDFVLTSNRATSASALSFDVSPSTFGQSVEFTASVTTSDTGSPGGTVTFYDGVTVLGTGTLDLAGVATFSTAGLTAGSHDITAEYGGDTYFLDSVSSIANLTVDKATTTTSLVSSADPIVIGGSVTFTATVATELPGSGIAAGTVTFLDGVTTLGTGSLNGAGVATFTTAILAVGVHSITAVYAGSSNFVTSTSSAAVQTVEKASSTAVITSSVTPAAYGQAVTLTAAVTSTEYSGATPSGTVAFYDGATHIGDGTLDGAGSATLITASLAVGAHSISAVYSGDGDFHGATASVFAQAVVRAATSSSVSSSSDPSVFGQTVTLTAAIAVTAPGAGVPSGTVTFRDGATVLGSSTLNSAGVATIVISDLAVGSHSLTVSYAGDTNFSASTSSAVPQTVNQAATQATLGSSVEPSVSGQGITLTATITAISPGSGTPTGSVTFYDGATVLGSASMDGSGAAAFTVTSLLAGTHSLSAVYGGDSNFQASTSSALSQTVDQASTASTVVVSVNPSVFGQPLTLTSTVVASGLGAGTPSGTVAFYDGATQVGTATLNSSGLATLVVTGFAVGSHTFGASYGGDSEFLPSNSSALTQVVNRAITSTLLSSSVNPTVSGQGTTFTATVAASSPGSGTPTGTVTIYDGQNALTSATLNGSGVATFTLASVAVGPHLFSVRYGGDTEFANSTSSTVTQTVNQASTATTLTTSNATTVSGQATTLTANVTVVSPGSQVPLGAATFYDGSTALGTVALDLSGVATLVVSGLSAGSHSLHVTYGGHANYSTSTSPAVTQTVHRASVLATINLSTSHSVAGQGVTLTAGVSSVSPGSGIPTGHVTFYDGGTLLGTVSVNGAGNATLTTTSLLVGSHSLIASYEGDARFVPDDSNNATLDVDAAATHISIGSSANPIVVGRMLTLTAGLGVVAPGGRIPSGTVTFKDGGAVIGSAALNGAGTASISVANLAIGTHTFNAEYSGDGQYLASTSVTLTQSVEAQNSNLRPTIVTPATAENAVVTTTSTRLSVGAFDDRGEEALTYLWSVIDQPEDGGVTFAANRSNAAGDVAVVFSAAGNYLFSVKVTDADGLSVESSVSVTVMTTLTQLQFVPPSLTLPGLQNVELSVVGRDQFGKVMEVDDAIEWRVIVGKGRVDSSGRFTAAGNAETVTVSATSGIATGVATLFVTAPIPAHGFLPRSPQIEDGWLNSVTLGSDADDNDPAAAVNTGPWSSDGLTRRLRRNNLPVPVTQSAVDVSPIASKRIAPLLSISESPSPVEVIEETTPEILGAPEQPAETIPAPQQPPAKAPPTTQATAALSDEDCQRDVPPSQNVNAAGSAGDDSTAVGRAAIAATFGVPIFLKSIQSADSPFHAVRAQSAARRRKKASRPA